MHLGPFEQRRISSINYDRADIERRMKQPHVIELAANTKRLGGGPMNPVLINDVTSDLIAGRDRLASELLNGKEFTYVRLARFCSARDLLELEVAENVHRRPVDRDALLARLVEVNRQEIRDEGAAVTVGRQPESAAPTTDGPASPAADSGQPARKPGRPVTDKGRARAAAAKSAGTTVEAVRSAEKRAAAKATPPAEAPLPIDDFDLGIWVGLGDEVRAVQLRVDALAGHLQAIQSRLTQAIEGDPDAADELVPGLSAGLAKLRDEAKALAGQVRAARPTSLCPSCKGTDPQCNDCRGRKWVNADEAKRDRPAELLLRGLDAMVLDGRGETKPYGNANQGETHGRTDQGKPATGAHRAVLRVPASAARAAGRVSAVRGDGDVAAEPAAQPGADGGASQAAGVEGRGGAGGVGQVAIQDSRLRGNGAGQAGDQPAHAQVLTSEKAMPGKGQKPGTTSKRRALAECGSCGAELTEDGGCACPPGEPRSAA